MPRGFSATLARWMIRNAGWRVEGAPPAFPRAVLIGAPHTSNWDLLPALLVSAVFDLHMRWLGKSSLFRPPIGFLMRMTGGIAVERDKKSGAVDWLVQRILSEERFVLCIAPEGTRSLRPHWKSGFYQIAREADLPVILGYADYSRKVFGFGPTIHLTGDIEADMAIIAAFYADKRGRHPELESPVRLAEVAKHDLAAGDETITSRKPRT